MNSILSFKPSLEVTYLVVLILIQILFNEFNNHFYNNLIKSDGFLNPIRYLYNKFTFFISASILPGYPCGFLNYAFATDSVVSSSVPNLK